MVKTIEKYACELCNTVFDTLDEALECEALPKPKHKYDVGLEVLLYRISGKTYQLASRMGVFYHTPAYIVTFQSGKQYRLRETTLSKYLQEMKENSAG